MLWSNLSGYSFSFTLASMKPPVQAQSLLTKITWCSRMKLLCTLELCPSSLKKSQFLPIVFHLRQNYKGKKNIRWKVIFVAVVALLGKCQKANFVSFTVRVCGCTCLPVWHLSCSPTLFNLPSPDLLATRENGENVHCVVFCFSGITVGNFTLLASKPWQNWIYKVEEGKERPSNEANHAWLIQWPSTIV